LGTLDNPISISCLDFIYQNSTDTCQLQHTTVVESHSLDNTNGTADDNFEPIFTAYDAYLSENPAARYEDFIDELASTPPMYNNENGNLLGYYFENFDDNNPQGFSFSGTGFWNTNNSQISLTSNNSSSTWYNRYVVLPTFTLNEFESPDFIQFFINLDGNSNEAYFEVSIDNGSWTNVLTTYASQDGFKTIPINYPDASSIAFRIRNRYFYNANTQIDNISYHTTLKSRNLFTKSDLQQSGTGSLQISDSHFDGNLRIVCPQTSVHIESSTLTRQSSTMTSAALDIMTSNASIGIEESIITGHKLSALQIHANEVSLISTASNYSNNGLSNMRNALHIVADDYMSISHQEDSISNNAGGILLDSPESSANSDISIIESTIKENNGTAFSCLLNSTAHFYGNAISGNFNEGIDANNGFNADISYTLIDDNGGHGISIGSFGTLDLNYVRVCDSGDDGIVSGSPTSLSHCNVGFNSGEALRLTGNNFHTVDNSILWGNNNLTYNQIDLQGGILSTSYSLIQGLSTYGVSGAGQFSLGEGLLEIDPLLADEEMHLQVYSPCVDAGQPWQQDQHMPYGLGGIRADMGMYGGPANAYWGGEALPDGASTLSGVTDSPQDQGNTVGLTFTGSYYDNSELVNNVTHYAFWRHYDPTGQPVSTLDEGNWELLGTMPAQSFAGYAYQAPTLGNTNDTGPFTSCYTVVAHTDDPDTYWYSNVLCGESVDNLAPMAPDLEGIVLEDGGAQLSWAPPTEEDYGYTMLSSDAGFFIEFSTDTLVVDATVVGGNTYTYTAIHYDVNGNASPPSEVTLAVAAQRDVIPLSAGWNLISLDRTPLDAAVAAVMADLEPGNLLYVTGFDAGASFYDPAGLSFLNTLSSLEDGYGYWVKVAADDTLRVEGAALPAGTLPTLDAGWNLVAYTAEGAASPATVFADLLAADELVYVTGFDGGVSIYDPAGLPFLNSLVAMQNGFGYWVKTVADYAGMGPVDDGGVMGDAVGAVRANPAFNFLNGTSDLGDRPGAFVDVIGPDGAVVGRMEVLPGGLLMTAAVYGDDPTTEALEGLSPGDVLHFALDGRLAAETAVWQGDMGHLKLDLHFDAGSGMAVFPNPVMDQATVQFELAEAGRVRLELLDATGRVIEVLLEADMVAGPQQLSLDAAALAPGVYSLSLRRGAAEPMLTRIAIQ